MRYSKLNRLAVAAVLGAYLVTGILSPKSLLGQALFFKLDNSLSGQSERSIALDERPFWTSHKHFWSSEQSSGDHILSTAEPWNSVITPKRLVEIQSEFHTTSAPLFPPNSLRAPPRS